MISISIQKYENLLSTNFVLQKPFLVDEVIPTIIDSSTNRLLTMIPSSKEIKDAVFDLNNNSAPGPDGFGAVFFQTHWEIVNKDVIVVVTQFFHSGWLPNNFNANSLILILKNPNAGTIDQFRPIALANFKFKIITKVLADRLAKILPSIISKEQRGFIRGRNIKDCIDLASEAVNVLDNKCFGGNIAMKIDISKAFHTLNWDFLIAVLKKQEGYFKCKRGVKQGDPLSPLLFCIAEEVLSRGITKLVEEGKVDLISASRNAKIPSHCLYVDDIMVYCKGKMSSLVALKELFTSYANCSGQAINLRKSSIYYGGINHDKLLCIVKFLDFSNGSLPFTF
ncbi:putative RNA-directed DNA polymerase [Medicago truncatula]|uniref:Putative RNA-directed DNA polymerase n=1 Tax=Medicago truncatula TaxID=3880 RepID=A0A396GQ21_MEDTR|nr:putative RNA-directed DNA polymerase [Medicago truncatula]